MKKWILLCAVYNIFNTIFAQKNTLVEVLIDTTTAYQTIHSFGASDAWAAQYVGNWPDQKRNAIADLLFSLDGNESGNPLGIGLSAWRFNIGAGSAMQESESGINDAWRRTEGFLQDDGGYDWDNQSGQQWFLQAAKKRGVNQFIAFVNSPPIQFTRNGKAHSDDGLSANLSIESYSDYASFLTKVIQYFKKEVGITFDYISPFNEPQWEWKGGQEGSPWNNSELAAMTRVLDSVLVSENIVTKIELTEAGAIDYLTGTKEKYLERSNQIDAFFNPSHPNYVGNLKSLAPKITGHSYFTTWDVEKFKKERQRIADKLLEYPYLEYWMSEYCILENNHEIRGKERDLGIQAALYMARVIHADLTIANASAWHWWLAMSPYNFKDGLIYHHKDIESGNFTDSKLLWVLGNYSRFIRPGAKRIKLDYPDFNEVKTLKDGILLSAFRNNDDSIVIVVINQEKEEINLKFRGLELRHVSINTYVTDEQRDLHSLGDIVNNNVLSVEGESVTTWVIRKN